ncbi:hypothetical protein [Halovivax ruber]|nr:hypothetical protein [Halovivax ruber]
MSANDRPVLSRRRLLAVSGGAFAATATGRAGASAERPGGDRGRRARWLDGRCPDATIEPSHGHCEESTTGGCADDHPETVAIQTAVAEALADQYPTVGALVDDGYRPYFDTLERGEDGWSHWLNPEYIGDDTVLDPERPGSVLVDNRTWRALGVMFIASRDGEPVDPPPVYGEGEPDDARCSPWHYHAGLPGRKAWWYYQAVYDEGNPPLLPPCRTPCVLHVWAVDHPESVYAHDAPPAKYRDGPADRTGLDTNARPGDDALGWETLPDWLVPDVLPAEIDPF